MERIIQNRKWILTSLVMTFFGVPMPARFSAVIIAMLGVGLAGIIEVYNIFITPAIYLLLKIFMLALGALMLFFSGRMGNVPEFYYVGYDSVGFAVIPWIRKQVRFLAECALFMPDMT